MRGVFFVHIMKTGGTTLSSFLRGQFDADRRYPRVTEGKGSLVMQQPTHLLGLPLETRRRFMVYSVHMPAWVAEAVAPGFRTVTVLREPVARTVSHLRQISGTAGAPDTLEAIWDEPEWRLRLVDYQTRFLAAERPSDELSEDMKEALRSHLSSEKNRKAMSDSMRPFYATAVAAPVPMGADDLQRAERRLRDFDVVGVTEALDVAAARLATLIGVEPPALGRSNATRDPRPVPRSFLRRLEGDLALDRELYETARTLASHRTDHRN